MRGAINHNGKTASYMIVPEKEQKRLGGYG